MIETQIPEAPGQRNTEHDLWLAMQAAYYEYRNASAALDDVASQLQGANPSAEGSLRIEKATSEQRTAFENYMEARMQFVEFRCDQNNARTLGFTDPNAVGGSTGLVEEKSPFWSWPGLRSSRLALPAAVAALLCTTALSLVYAVHERVRVYDAGAARGEIGATLNQARDEIQALVRKIDGVNVTQQFAIRESNAPTAPVHLRRNLVTKTAKRKPTGEERWRRTQAPPSATQERSNIVRKHQKLIHPVQNFGARSYWTFMLPVSRQFQGVGPLRLSLRSVNLKQKDFDLCVTTDEFKIEHLSLHEPVWIILHDPLRRVELVATRIEKNQVQGYVSELNHRKSELTASQLRRTQFGGS